MRKMGIDWSEARRARQIVRGQRVAESKVAFAKQLRHAMMPTETLLWEQLRDRRLNNLKFRRQQIVLGYIADFYCHAASLVIEIDGAYHDKTYDAERDKAFQGRCIQVLRVPAGQVETNLEDVLREIAQAAQRQLASAKRNYPPLFGEPKATVGEGRKERSDASG